MFAMHTTGIQPGEKVNTDTGEVTAAAAPAPQPQHPDPKAGAQAPAQPQQKQAPTKASQPAASAPAPKANGPGVATPPPPPDTKASVAVTKTAQGLQLVEKTGNKLNQFLTQYSEQIKGALPKNLPVERLIRITSTAVSRNPKLLDCDMGSMLAAVIQCGQLGLEPDTLGQAYLVPFYNSKTQRQEVQFIPGYKGLRDLAYRSGLVNDMHAGIVYEKDDFSFEYGSKHYITHKPNLMVEDRGKKLCWYAYAHIKGGGLVFVVLTHKDIAKAKAASKAAGYIWTSDPDAMEIKTAVRRLCDELPKTVENQNLNTALKMDRRNDAGIAGGGLGQNGEFYMADPEEFDYAEVVD